MVVGNVWVVDGRISGDSFYIVFDSLKGINMDEVLMKCEIDFEWYKKKLNANAQYEFAHNGKPTKYPCKVTSSLEYYNGSSFGGRDTYDHIFIYQVEKTCSSCGHKEIIWPDELK